LNAGIFGDFEDSVGGRHFKIITSIEKIIYKRGRTLRIFKDWLQGKLFDGISILNL
jgi:hypothetical protein